MIWIVDDPKSNISPEIFQKLTTGTSYPFSEGLHDDLPLANAGAYTIWRGAEFIYVGIAGRGLDLTIEHKRMRGIRDRIPPYRPGHYRQDQPQIPSNFRRPLLRNHPPHRPALIYSPISMRS
jgi:hypothetical protein